jgi:membrane associated rhomboid family serine protease
VSEPQPDPDSDVTDAPPAGPGGFRLRRAPRYRPFGLTGAAVGVLAGVVLALSFTATSDYSVRTITGYFAAIFGLVGTVIGLGLAVLLERRRRS